MTNSDGQTSKIDGQPRLADIIRETMRNELRLVSIGGEPCEQCGETLDYSFKVKDGCLDKLAQSISDLVFAAMANGDISATKIEAKPYIGSQP